MECRVGVALRSKERSVVVAGLLRQAPPIIKSGRGERKL